MGADPLRALARDLTATLEGRDITNPLAIPIPTLLELELVLTLLHDHLPGQDPSLGWTMLTGLQYPAYSALSDEGNRAVAVVRSHLTRLAGRSAWERYLGVYRSLPEGYPLYALSPSEIAVHPSAALAEGRLATLRATLRTPASGQQRPASYAPAGRYRFQIRREPAEVEITEEMAALPARSDAQVASHAEADSDDNSPPKMLRVTRAALLAEAAWMDAHAPAGSPAAGQDWTGRMAAVQLRTITPDGLAEADTLVLDRILHLPGMVGSGKSTMLIVLTVYLARRGYRTLLVENEVTSLLREQAIFEALAGADPALAAVPIIGQTTRADHLRRLHLAEARRAGAPCLHEDHPGFQALSTVCPLDGARRDLAPIPIGAEPCSRLYPIGSDGQPDEELAYDCPLLPLCPVHRPTRQLPTSRIWLCTPASLLLSGPQAALVGKRVRTVELAIRARDVLLVDEADLVQTQFDIQFAPHEALIGGPDALLDRLGMQVSRQIYRAGRPLIGRDRAFDRWLSAHQNAQRAADYLYRWLRESETGRTWLSRGYFSRQILLDRIRARIAEAGLEVGSFDSAAADFLATPLGGPGDPTSPAWDWRLAANGVIATGDPTDPRGHLGRWLRAQPGGAALARPVVDQLADMLLIALVVAVLDHSLQEVVWDWGVAAAYLDLDRGRGGLFYEPSDSLLRLVPETAMGGIIGFQYKDTGDGQLSFFRLRGLGRHLLYHLHDALEASTGQSGPLVLLTSGTSWAPGSWRYDLHLDPTMLLLPQWPARLEGSAVPSMVYEPIPDPNRPGEWLTVSGVEDPAERVRRLRAMVHRLAESGALDGQSMLDRELTDIAASAPHRQLILLVVGSYDEAAAVGDALVGSRTDRGATEVLTMIREGGEDPSYATPDGRITRSLLKDIPGMTGSRFLVAPLEAIERGHNIVVGQEAAIGAVYFLVRRMLRPGEFHEALQQVNAWTLRALPTFDAPAATLAGAALRRAAHRAWDRALDRDYRFAAVAVDDALAWTLLVPIWQTIGRALRGGVGARIHFVDAAWAPQSARGKYDTSETSMILRFADLLAAAVADPDPARRAVAEALYGQAARAFAGVEHVYRSEDQATTDAASAQSISGDG